MFERLEKKIKRLTQYVPTNQMPYQDEVIEAFAKHFEDGNGTYKGGETWSSVMFNGVHMIIAIRTTDDWNDVIERIKDVRVDNVTFIETSCYGKIKDQSVYLVYLNYTYETPFDNAIEKAMSPCGS